jgi:hypothetical protein
MPTACSIPRKDRAGMLFSKVLPADHPHSIAHKNPTKTQQNTRNNSIDASPARTPKVFLGRHRELSNRPPNCAAPRAPEVRSGSPVTPHSALPAQSGQFTSALPITQEKTSAAAGFSLLPGIRGNFHTPGINCRYSQSTTPARSHPLHSPQAAP